jgi:hypothetical protein
MELYDEINTLNQVEKVQPQDAKGNAAFSLRQIMAEQQSEEFKREKKMMKKKGASDYKFIDTENSSDNGYCSLPVSSSDSSLLQNGKTTNFNKSDFIANRIKLKQFQEKYENFVDPKMIEEILESKEYVLKTSFFMIHKKHFHFFFLSYNYHEATKFIDEFFNLENVQEPKKVFDLKSRKPRSSCNNMGKSNDKNGGGGKHASSSSSNKLDYYNTDHSYDLFDNNGDYTTNESRYAAQGYVNLRQEYFEKASLAYSKGWGAVAQYYAEMGHQQSSNMKKSNNLASMQIFLSNNIDIRNSNTLDLHGLHVKEAMNVLKNVIVEKKNGKILNHFK